MKRPSNDSLELAADWLESNEGDECPELANVAAWLREQVFGKVVRDAARKGGVPVKALRTRLGSAQQRGVAK